MAGGDIDVLIVGAGPTGLTLACQLAARGVDFRIIDAAPCPQRGSRGKGLQPRSLELLDDLGIVDRVIANGRFDLPIRYYDEAGNSKVESLHAQQPARPDAPYLSPLLTPQYRVEEALRARLSELGGSVDFGAALCGFTQDEDGVAATLQTAHGDKTIRARYLIGCDGGKSVVRHIAEIPFLGETLDSYRMLVADVRVEGLDRDHWHIWRSKEGFLALCPLPSTEEFQFQASVAPGQDDSLSLETLQDGVKRSGHSDIVLREASWMSLWRANIRMVDRYRAGRVFLAGDAAHVHSPAGGQGMNTGIQDACNLGWKLAAVLAGADAGLLDSYQDERLPIAAWVLGVSNELMNATVASGTIAFRRDDKTLQLGLNYRHSSLSIDKRPAADGLRAGDRAPDAPGLQGPDGTRRMFDLLRDGHYTLIGMGDRWQDLIEACVARSGGRLRGFAIADKPGNPTSYFDSGGHARAAYGQDVLFVIRPDCYIGLATAEEDADTVMTYLASIMPRP